MARAPTAEDHKALRDLRASRRYFATFRQILDHLPRVAADMRARNQLSEPEIEILATYLTQLGHTFHALSMKYLLVGRDTGRPVPPLTLDTQDSGFPVFNELLIMANDAQQAATHLDNMPGAETLKRQMVDQIVAERDIPTRLQFALAQRLYYQELARGELFWAQNDPRAIVLYDRGKTGTRPRLLIHWAVYDSQVNLPTIYLMELEDSGRTPLLRDTRRWPEVQAHLMGQALGGLKLLTIAKGFDDSFDDLHPKSLRRLHLGPLYAHGYTRQSGPLHEVLSEAAASVDQNWALAWTDEILQSERVIEERAGWFGTVEREVFALDPFSGRGADIGATRMDRSIILPERPYQVLAEKSPPGFAQVTKYVVGSTGRVLRY